MKNLSAIPPIPRRIVTVTALHMATGAGAAIAWWFTGDASIIVDFFHYFGALFLIGLSAAEVWLSAFCWRQFAPDDVLRKPWFLIMAAAALHLTGNLCSQWLGVESEINPLVYCDLRSVKTTVDALHEIGTLLAGPLQMVPLAYGLLLVLRVCRRSILLLRFSRFDWLMLTALIAYTTREAWQVLGYVRAGKSFTTYEVFSWTSDPLLIVLLFEAICLRRSVLSMGQGLVAKCWGAFAAAIVLTALGDVGIWATWNGYLAWPLNAIGWYVWSLAASAYAVGPAYQVEAFRHVRGKLIRMDKLRVAA